MKIQSDLVVDGVVTADAPTLDQHLVNKEYVDSKHYAPPGGTAGQILSKATSADYDYEWIDADPAIDVGGIYRLGNSSIAGSPTAPVRYRHYAQKITVSQESMLHAIEIYCENVGGSPFNVIPGLFVDNASTPGRLLSVGSVAYENAIYIPASTDTPYGGPAWLSLTISAALTPGDYWIAFFTHDSSMPDFRVYKETGPADSSYYWTASGMWLSPGYTGLQRDHQQTCGVCVQF